MTAQANEPWHTDKWFTSPWNHHAQVAGSLAFPADVEIHDVTLRDGEQQAGVVFTADDKVRIAEALAEAGVHRIEAGLPAVSETDAAAVRQIAGMGLPSKIYAFSRYPAIEPRVADGLDRISVSASDDEKLEILAKVKALSLERKALLDDDDLRTIADSVLSSS